MYIKHTHDLYAYKYIIYRGEVVVKEVQVRIYILKTHTWYVYLQMLYTEKRSS